MKATFDGCTFENNGRGIVTVGDVELSATGSVFRGNGTAVEVHRPDVMHQVGLPQQTPFHLVEELAQAIVRAQAESAEKKLEIARDSRLSIWLTNTAKVFKTAKDLVDIAVKVAGILG